MHNSWAQPIQDLEITLTAGTEEEEQEQRSKREGGRNGGQKNRKNKQMLHVRGGPAENLQ